MTVGDRVTETVWKEGRVPDVQIVDSKENRRVRDPPDVPHERTIEARNPPGAVAQEAIDAIREAYAGKKPARVLIEGEEDLLTIPAVMLGPVTASVFYGQPGEGIVQVRVTRASKARNKAFLAEMGADFAD